MVNHQADVSISPRSGAWRDRRLPTIDALAALGPLLCLSRSRDTLLSGWRRAVACEYDACVDSNGLRECLRFRGADGECCWQLYALPEDDFLAWERLIASVPGAVNHDVSPGLAERVCRRVSDALIGRRWRVSLIRIHAFLGRDGVEQRCLAISQPCVSSFSLSVARRIAHLEGAEPPPLETDTQPERNARGRPDRLPRTQAGSLLSFTSGTPS